MTTATDDTQARQEAIDPTQSFIVQAPAGSGKTGLLTQRFLRLLARSEHPEEILAITFTRKAASEMSERIFKALQDSCGPAPESEFAKQTWELARQAMEQSKRKKWDILKRPDRLRIRTIDSLCNYLTGQMPLLSRFGAPLGIAEQCQELYEEAADSLLDEISNKDSVGEALLVLLRHLNNNVRTLKTDIANMLATRDQWIHLTAGFNNMDEETKLLEPKREYGENNSQAEILPTDSSEISPLLKYFSSSLQTVITDHLEKLVKAVRKAKGSLALSDFFADLGEMADYACNNGYEQAEPLRGITQCPGATIEDLPQWRAMRDFMITGKEEPYRKVGIRQGFPPAKDGSHKEKNARFTDLCDELNHNEEFLALLKGVTKLPPAEYPPEQLDILKAVLVVLNRAAAHLWVTFMNRGECDYCEVAISAQRALGSSTGPTDLALRLDYAINHILVDEYQDTSELQYKLLNKLTAGWEPGDGRTIFLVGDPMQSIYRFRKAEVGIFLRTRDEGFDSIRAPQQLKSLQLKTNFRSASNMVDWFNNCFTEAFPSQEDRCTSAISYSQAQAILPAIQQEPVELHLFDEEEEEEEEARQIALTVERELAENPEASIAILVRARTRLKHILPQLQEHQRPYQAVEIQQLDKIQTILDLLSITKAIVHPGDSVSWLALLRSPYCGLTLDEIYLLLGERKKNVTVAEHLRKMVDSGALPSALGQRMQRLLGALDHAWQQLGRQNLRRLTEAAWIALGGPAALASAYDLQLADEFFTMLDKFSSSGILPSPEELDKELAALYAQPDLSAPPNLQVLTIHKSKGLEYDVVIIPGLQHGSGSTSSRLLRIINYTDNRGDTFPIFAPTKSSGAPKAVNQPGKGENSPESQLGKWINSLESQLEKNELSRMVYVAATRARKKLYLFACTKKSVDKRSMLHILCNYPDIGDKVQQFMASKDSEAAAGPNEQSPETNDEAAIPASAENEPAKYKRLPADWQLPAPEAFHYEIPGSPSEADIPTPKYDWATIQASYVGTVTHRCLSMFGQLGIENWSTERLAELEPHIRRQLCQLGAPQKSLEDAVDKTLLALKTALQSPKLREAMKSSSKDSRYEWPLETMHEGRPTRRIIDRTYIDSEGIRWIIDFKTSGHEGSDMDNFLTNEKARYKDQLENYARLIRCTEPNPIKLALYFVMLDKWITWDYPG